MKAVYTKALPLLLEGQLWRSESFADFLTWLKSDDRCAQDLRRSITEYGLNEKARAWVTTRRRIYEANPAQFKKDREGRLIHAPKIINHE